MAQLISCHPFLCAGVSWILLQAEGPHLCFDAGQASSGWHSSVCQLQPDRRSAPHMRMYNITWSHSSRFDYGDFCDAVESLCGGQSAGTAANDHDSRSGHFEHLRLCCWPRLLHVWQPNMIITVTSYSEGRNVQVHRRRSSSLHQVKHLVLRAHMPTVSAALVRFPGTQNSCRQCGLRFSCIHALWAGAMDAVHATIAHLCPRV